MNPAIASLESIFAEAVEIASPAERAAFVERACGCDPALRAQAERLIADHFRAGSFLEHPAGVLETAAFPAPDEMIGARIGPYKLLEQIGEGGMGLVYVAEQQQPLRRTVALKIIKPGMDSKQVIARFEAERQALAMMDHPNIAKVLDAGTIPGEPGCVNTGRPYFVMELVRGIPITEYCDQARLTVRQRLEVFVQVCRAVQHAHTKGVIHRDIKPTNVLVTSHDGVPVPLVIDFGVAKALGQQLTEHTLHTGIAQMVGTPLYMSPEQAEFNQLGVDTRSDIYSLGVLLYELLTGATPFDGERLRTAGYDELRRILREEEPPRPSARLTTLGAALSTASQRRGVDQRKLTQTLRGELDWIVLKALEKDRNRRYETASAFAADIDRYLKDEPVEACPPSAAYRLKKFARRHKGALAVAAGALALMAVLAGSVGWVVRDRGEQRRDAERRIDEGLAEVERLHMRGRWTVARDALRGIEPLLAGRVSADRSERVRAWRTDLDMVDQLAEIKLRRTTRVGGFYENESADGAYAAEFRKNGIDVEALELNQAAGLIRARAVRLELATALEDWASVRRSVRKKDGEEWRTRLLEVASAGDPDETRARVRNALQRGNLAALQNLTGSANPAVLPAATLAALGVSLREQGDIDGAVALLHRAQHFHPGDFWINFELAESLRRLSTPRFDQALSFYVAAAAISPQSASARNKVGWALGEIGLLAESEAWFRDAIRLEPGYSQAHYNLGYTFTLLKKPAEAEACYRDAIRLWPEDHMAHNNLGQTLKDLGRPAEAEACYREAIRLKPDYVKSHNNLGAILRDRLNQPAEAATCFREAIRLQPNNPQTHNNLGAILHDQLDQPAEAAKCFREAIRLKPDLSEAHANLGNALCTLGKPAEAVACYEKAIRLKPDDFRGHSGLGSALDMLGRPTEAEASYREALRLEPNMPGTHLNVGWALTRLGRFEEAAACYREAIRLKPDHVLAHINLCSALGKMGDWGGVLAECEKAIELLPRHPAPYNTFAWLLATCPDPKFRDPGRAVEHARRAVELAQVAVKFAPKEGAYWNTLGVAEYRAGDYKSAIVALTKSMGLRKGGSADDWLFLAMAHHQLGNKATAHTWYDKAVAWMDKNVSKDEELVRLRAEAAALLGIPADDPKTPPK